MYGAESQDAFRPTLTAGDDVATCKNGEIRSATDSSFAGCSDHHMAIGEGGVDRGC